MLSRESVTFKVLRDIRKDLAQIASREIAITVHPRVAEMLLGPMKDALAELSGEVGREIEVRARPGIHQEHFEVLALGDAEPVELDVPWLVGRSANGSAVDLAEDEDDDPIAENGAGGESGLSAKAESDGCGGSGDDGDASEEPRESPSRPPPFSDLSNLETFSIESLAAEDDELLEAAGPAGGAADSGEGSDSAADGDASGEPVDATPEFRILPRSGESEEA